jgi:hypothetical protein
MYDHGVGPGDLGTVFQADEEGHEVPVRVEVVKALTVPGGLVGTALVATTVSYRVRRLDNGEMGTVYADTQWAPDPGDQRPATRGGPSGSPRE